MKTYLVLTFLLFFYSSNAQLHFASERSNGEKKSEVDIDINLSFQGKEQEEVKLLFSPVEYLEILNWDSVKSITSTGNSKEKIKADAPVYLSTNSLFKDKKLFWSFAEPGDSIHISSDGKHLNFSGIGVEKFRLKYELDSTLAAIPVSNKFENHKSFFYGRFTTISADDYLEWTSYLKKRLDCIISITDAYKNKLSEYAYILIKAEFIDRYIQNQSDKFNGLLGLYEKGNAGLTLKNVCDIYDTVYYPAIKDLYKWASQYIYHSYMPIVYEVRRRYSFDKSRDPLNSALKRRLLYYELARQTFKGIAWDKFVLDFLIGFAEGMKFTSEAVKLLDEYYAEPAYPVYKMKVKELEMKARGRVGRYSPLDFSLIDANGKIFTKANIKGKVAVLDFWFTGCFGCVAMAPALHKVEEKFKNDTNVVFINVSIDNDKNIWLKSIKEKRFTSGGGINLYTGGKGVDHPMIEDYAVDGYPKIYLINPYDRFISHEGKIDPRVDEGEELIKIIQAELTYLKDGPYVFYQGDTSSVFFINSNSVINRKYHLLDMPQLKVQTDQNITFTAVLKKSLTVEKCEFTKPDKLLAISDIEGNFAALRGLLQANHVIDSEFNWTFGNGHLVFNGDMFDRGNQVTECLWLIYSLEEKAKAAGGYVHFILGNHEIMNLQGDHRYVIEKYENNSTLLGKNITQLHGKDTELGRWLRTKNIVEKIGNLLFIHGGISEQLNDLPVTIQEINHVARSSYDNTDKSYIDEKSRIIMDNSFGPFWYRGYYKDVSKEKIVNQIERTLKRFKVERIITGHTIVGDTVNVHYNNNVINIDTKHREGQSEALLVESNEFYRVNQEGEKTRLFANSLSY